jgi:sugar/nucleoside kinase (ribokinase family)
MSVLIFGSVALDSIETPRGKVSRAQGGSGSYAAVAASYFCRPAVLGAIGDDYPREHLDRLRARGISLEALQVIPGGHSFHWSGFYKGSMHEAVTRETVLGVVEDYEPRIPASMVGEVKHILLGNLAPEQQLAVLDQIREPELVVVDTMNLWIQTKRDELMKVLRRADIVVVNDQEARLLGESISLSECAKYLLALGCRFVIIKKGEHGAELHGHDGYFFSLPAFPITQLMDPTGAGDSFAGGMIGFLSSKGRWAGMPLNQAIAVGTVMASFCVEAFSCDRTARLTSEEINQRLDRFHLFTQFEPVEL